MILPLMPQMKFMHFVVNNWRGVWNKALSDFWCNAKFSWSFTTEYKENLEGESGNLTEVT